VLHQQGEKEGLEGQRRATTPSNLYAKREKRLERGRKSAPVAFSIIQTATKQKGRNSAVEEKGEELFERPF